MEKNLKYKITHFRMPDVIFVWILLVSHSPQTSNCTVLLTVPLPVCGTSPTFSNLTDMASVTWIAAPDALIGPVPPGSPRCNSSSTLQPPCSLWKAVLVTHLSSSDLLTPAWYIVCVPSGAHRALSPTCPSCLLSPHLTHLHSSHAVCMPTKSLQSCPILCDPMDGSPPGSSVHGVSGQEHWSGLPWPPPGDLPDPEIKPMSLLSPHWQVGSLPLVQLPWTAWICQMCQVCLTIYLSHRPVPLSEMMCPPTVLFLCLFT